MDLKKIESSSSPAGHLALGVGGGGDHLVRGREHVDHHALDQDVDDGVVEDEHVDHHALDQDDDDEVVEHEHVEQQNLDQASPAVHGHHVLLLVLVDGLVAAEPLDGVQLPSGSAAMLFLRSKSFQR